MSTSSAGVPDGAPLDRHALHEVGQMCRALEANGPRTEEELAVLVGAPYWERHRFRRALTHMLTGGIARRDRHGLIRIE